MQESREQTLLAMHRLGEGFRNPPRRARVGAGIPMWVSLLVGYHKPSRTMLAL